MIEISCRHCATKYKVRENLCGRTAECKTCGRRFTVPYASPVVRLGDEDLAGDDMTMTEAEAVARPHRTPDAQRTADTPPAAIPLVEAPSELANLQAAEARKGRPAFAEHRRRKLKSALPADVPLVPLPEMVSQLWLPLALAVICLGSAAYLIFDFILNSPGRQGGLVLVVFGVAALLVIAYRLTLRSLESAAHTFDIHFSDAIALQTIGCLSVPVLGGVIGLVQGGLVGMAVGVLIGALLCPLVMTLVFQLPAGKGMQSGLIASLAFLVGYAASALLVAGVANVMFTVWSVDLPWKAHPTANQLADAAMPAKAPAIKPEPLPPPSVSQPANTNATPASAVVPQASPAVSPAVSMPVVVPETAPAEQPKPMAPAAVPQPAPAAPAPTPPSPAPAVPPVVAPVTPAAPPVDPKLIALNEAASELIVGRYSEAASKSADLQKTLPKAVGRLSDTFWIDTLHIQAVAQMKLGQPAKAAVAMQRVLDSGKANRSVVINHAVCDILNKTNASRAVKNLQAYAATHPDDETVINLWGVALDTFARREKGVNISRLADDYMAANTLLERTRPGQHHWGTSWVSGGEWAGIESQRSSANSQINSAQQSLRDANVRFDNANRAYQQVNVVIIGRPLSEYERDTIDRRKRLASSEIDEARRDVESAKVRLDQAKQQLPRPTWAMTVEPVDPELLSR